MIKKVLRRLRWHAGKASPETISKFIGPYGAPRRLEICGVDSEFVARQLATNIVGRNHKIRWVSGIGPQLKPDSLVYLSQESYACYLDGSNSTVITSARFAELVPESCSKILVSGEPKAHWAALISVLKSYVEEFPSFVHPSAQVHRTCIIGKGVYLDEGVKVGPNVILKGPLYVGSNSVIGPGSVIGNDGFELAMVGTKRNSVSHLGGVWISSEVEIHANVVIDKSLDGGFTFIGSGCKIDSLVFIAHAVHLGQNCVVVASTEISGSAQIGENVWFAPNCTITNGVTIGDNSMIGIGSVVLKNVADNSIIVGHHQLIGFRCACGRRLAGSDSTGQCECGSFLGSNNG